MEYRPIAHRYLIEVGFPFISGIEGVCHTSLDITSILNTLYSGVIKLKQALNNVKDYLLKNEINVIIGK